MDWGAIAILGFVLLIIGFVWIFSTRYKKCPSDQIMVVYGKVGKGRASLCLHGGAKFIIPLIQAHEFISLRPIALNINLKNALSNQNIRINVPSTFTIGVSTDPAIMSNAAERLLGLQRPEIEELASEIIFGQLRLSVASMTIEDINGDREGFLELIQTNVIPELNKVGMYLINVNITDITDEADYISSLGKKESSKAINQAMIDVADAERDGAVGKAEADKVREIQVAENQAESAKGKKKADAEKRIYVEAQEADAVQGENISRANIAQYNADLAVKEAESMRMAEVARRNAAAEIEKAQYTLEGERLRAEEIAREEVAKLQMEIAAEAEAERLRRTAQGAADATLAKYHAEAEGVKAVLEAKAAGYASLVQSAGGDAKAAATLLMVEKIEEIVGKQVEAISNLKIDKITVWDSAGGGNGEGSSTANFVSSLIHSLPPVHDVAKMAGVDLPDYLGKVSED
ncbi:MAG: SPFH domain-containing protein [Candidatus Thermoplasmatota archaeon]|nr:flotillin [Euryarchaeota archaeon]MAN07747.1 flotillin [Euryarchaeota archaeon]MED5350167.1 SPFH domain-containing protein [Candidatus Thermoplasmatota archaeon]DAC14598.1 MAG TPA: flotillin family protein [Candidatus Poseidoniales archaeon]HII63670.1 flotillin family protein [Candidatus Poseidoniaceae archaeon]|tara:strand:- start:1435 stop:2817 length:1383 start_codon:yes stop_codon:yes gene_type:complete